MVRKLVLKPGSPTVACTALVDPPMVDHVMRMSPPCLVIDVICGAKTSAVVEPAADVQPLESVSVTLYVPLAAGETFAIDGFWSVDVNPFGPVQLYVAPATVLAVRLNVAPATIGPLLPAVGAAGTGFTVAVVDPAAEVQPLLEIVTEYMPLASVVALGMDGFC